MVGTKILKVRFCACLLLLVVVGPVTADCSSAVANVPSASRTGRSTRSCEPSLRQALLTMPDMYELRKDILAWIETLAAPDSAAGRWKNNTHMSREWGVNSTGVIIDILADLDELSSWSVDRKRHVASVIQSWQDPNSGLFIDPLVKPEHKVSDHHTWEHIWNHITSGAVTTLKRLGAEPLYPTPTVFFHELRADNVENAVMSLDWTNPWMAGEHWSSMMRAYRDNHGLTGSVRTDAVTEKACAVLESRVLNPMTGYPDNVGTPDPIVAMCGLFKILNGYLEMARPYPFPKAAIDSTLALQQASGSFGRERMTIQWDATWVLKNLNEQLTGQHRFTDIRDAGARLANYLYEHYRKPDGGFSFNKDVCMTQHNSILMAEPLCESDAFGTFMALECMLFAKGWTQGRHVIPSAIEMRWRDPRINIAPAIFVAAVPEIILGDSATLKAFVSDDGLSGSMTVRWNSLSGPGDVTFSPETARITGKDDVKTQATFRAPGTYALQVTADDGELVSRDVANITVKSTRTE